jgi:hypothetical protein
MEKNMKKINKEYIKIKTEKNEIYYLKKEIFEKNKLTGTHLLEIDEKQEITPKIIEMFNLKQIK